MSSKSLCATTWSDNQLTKEYVYEELMDSFDFITNITEEHPEGITIDKLKKLAERFGFKQKESVLQEMIDIAAGSEKEVVNRLDFERLLERMNLYQKTSSFAQNE